MDAPERHLSARALLAREERRTVTALRRSLLQATEQAFATETLRRFVRERPELALAAGAGLGALLGPSLLRAAHDCLPPGLATRLALRLASELAVASPAPDGPAPNHDPVDSRGGDEEDP